MNQSPVVLISGLPRSGKTSLADALRAEGFTHVPLDRYFHPIPSGSSFLDWVGSPRCINWNLVESHLAALDDGASLVAPSGLDVSWGAGGMQQRRAESRREMRPSQRGYAIPGCYAFDCPRGREQIRVFVRTPRRVIAERALGREVAEGEVEELLDVHLSSNWRAIERFEDVAEVVVSGLESHEQQVATIRGAVGARHDRT